MPAEVHGQEERRKAIKEAQPVDCSGWAPPRLPFPCRTHWLDESCSPFGHIGWTNRAATLRQGLLRPSVRGERPFCEAGYTCSPTEGELKTPPLPLRRTCTMARVAALKERVLTATGELSFNRALAPPPRVSLHASFMRGAVTGRIHSSGSVLTRLAARGRASQARILATRRRSGSRGRCCRASKVK